MKLCIAEKPSVAKEIAKIIGANNRKDGYLEGNGYQVSWTFGHFCTLKTPDEYAPEWKSWSLYYLPMIPKKFQIKVMDNSGVKKQFGILQNLIASCSEVINCGDAGIEGELIQRWVLAKAGNNKPTKRLWISSLTENAIKEGFKNLQDSSKFDLLYAAGNARAIGDWLLGMNASRLYTLKYANNKGVLSIGRVQTPTLSLIVKRFQEIQNFKPEIYWELKTIYKDTVFSTTKGKFNTKEKASEIIEKIKGKNFTILSSTKKEGKEHPPKLFDLTSLQVECNKKFAFTAEDTLKYIQSLYEKKLVTYPRVDTAFLPTDMYPKIPEILKGIQPYANFTAPLLQTKIPKTKRVFDNDKITDHHAIIPTGINPSNLILDEKKVFDTIARRFISVFYPDCIISNTEVIGAVENNKFKATGKEILKEGWRVLYPQKNQKKESETQLIPNFIINEFGPHKPTIVEKQTNPPKQYTEATLLRAMETAGKQIDDEELSQLMKENGIGRPSTRANIIETLFRRKYVVRQKRNLIPTNTGIQLINTIKNDILTSVELTGMWEKKLRQIERNEYDVKLFIEEMKEMVTNIVAEVKADNSKYIEIAEEKKAKNELTEISDKTKKTAKVKEEKNILSILCPKCKKGHIIKGKSAYGCSEYKSGCDFKIPFVINNKKLTEKQTILILKKGKTSKIKGFVINGEKTDGKILLNNNFEAIFEPIETTVKSNKLTCPKCKLGEILKGKNAYGCNKFNDGCNFVLSFKTLSEKYGTTKITQKIINSEVN